MTPVGAAPLQPEPDAGLAIDIAVPDARWHDVDPTLEAAVDAAVRAATGHAGLDAAEAEISVVGSRARVFVIPTDEERVIATDTFDLISNG